MTQSSEKKHGLFFGVLLVVLGALFLLDQNNIVDIGDLWPLIIVAAGIWMIIKPKSCNNWESKNFGDQQYVTDSDKVIRSNSFGDINVTIDSKKFTGGQIGTTFGCVKVDLTNIDVVQGEQILHINTTFGDIKISVPKNVPYSIYASNTAGDMKVFDEKRSGWKQEVTHKSSNYDSSSNKVRIIASQVFGDFKVW